MAEENKKLHFDAVTGKWENLPEGYEIQGNKNYKIGDKTVAVLYTYQPYWSEYETVLLVADGKEAHYTVTTIPRNFDFSRVDSLDYDYMSAVANQQVRYELSWQFPGIVPRYEKNLFGFGFQPVFDDLEKAKEYGKRMRDVLVSCPTELLGKSFTKDHNPHYTYFRHDYIELNEYKVRDGIPVLDMNIYRVPALLSYESDMFAVVDALRDKGYDIKGDGIKNVWYMDFDTEAGAKDFARALHAAMVDNDNLSRPYADLMKTLSNPNPDTDDIIYERIYFMEKYAKMMARYGEGAFDIDLAGKGVTTLDRITRNLPSTEIRTLRYDNGKITFFGQDGNSYRIEHLSGDSAKALIKVENEVLESEKRSRSPKENPYLQSPLKLITLPSSGLNLGDNPTEDVKNAAHRIQSEQTVELNNTQAYSESSNTNINMEENKDKTYYLSVAYLQESDAKEYLDKYRESDSKALLYEAANWDQGDDIVQSNVYSRQGVHPGDMTLAQDENYALIYNTTTGGDYEVLRKITEQDIRWNIERYGLESDATEDVKKIAYAMAKEEFQSIKKEPAFEMENGSLLHFQYNENTNKVEVGTVTNAGLTPLHEFDYDHDYTLEENMGDIYSKLSNMEEYQAKEIHQPESVSFDTKEDLKAYITDYCEKHGWDSDLNHIDVSKITDMSELFAYTDFSGDVSRWETSNVTNMSYMFQCTPFNGALSEWDVSNVKDMSWMFEHTPFNQPLDKWDTSKVEKTFYMFANSKFNHDISMWKVSEVKFSDDMFYNSAYTYPMPSFAARKYTLPEQEADMANEVSAEQDKDAYTRIKEKKPDAVIICQGRDGKFRIYGKDAEYVSSELYIPLEKRQSDGMPMITFTSSEYDLNLPKIISTGKRCAIISGEPVVQKENIKTEETVTKRVHPADKWKELKEQHPDKVILLHDDGRYMSYDSDARDICKALRIYTLKDVSAGLDLAYWENKGEDNKRYDKVVDAIGNLSVWDIINPDTKEARERAIVRGEVKSLGGKTWQDLKDDNPKNVVLTLKDGRYYAYQEDAKSVSKLLGLELAKREDYVLTTSFPATALDVYGKRIKASGHNLVLTDIEYTVPVKKEKEKAEPREAGQETDPVEKWKELKAQNPDKTTLMQHKTGYLVVGKDADAIPVGMGIIHEKFDTQLGTAVIVSSLYRDLAKLQQEVGPLAVWDDVSTKDIKVRYMPEENREIKQDRGQEQEQVQEDSSLSPLRQQWTDLKKEHPDSVILLKSGDFYMTYEEDARKASEILGITLIKNTGENCYQAGFPVSVLDKFTATFNRAQCPFVLSDFEVTEQKSEVEENKKPDEQGKAVGEETATPQPSQETDESARVDALKGESYQAYLLDKALGNAALNGGVFVNERRLLQASLFPHNGISIPAFNNVIMTLHTERMSYATNTYTTFRGAQSQGIAVMRDERSLGVNNFGVSFYVNTFKSSDVITKAQYNQLPAEERQQYRPANKMRGFKDKILLFNIDQTNASSRDKELYKELVASAHREKKRPPKSPKDNVRRYDEMVKNNPNTMPLFKNGHFYESYKEGALVLSHLFDAPVTDDKKKGCKVASFPASKLDEYLPQIAGQYHVSVIEPDLADGKAVIDYRKEATEFLKKVACEMGVRIDKTTYMLTTYEKKDDTISLHVNNLAPGKPNTTDIKDINAMYRAISQAVEIPDRLDRSGRIVLNYGDCEKYDSLVTELVAASLMIRQGLPARISEESMELIPYWQRELRENPKMVSILELNTNATMKAIMRHYEGKEVDYSKLRGTSQRMFLPEQDYSIVRNLASFPNVENRSAVIIRDPESKEAAVILPAGASTEVNNEIPGMNKHRYELALGKEGFETVKFFNADGYLSLNQPNSYFKDKVVTVEQLHQYDLNEVVMLDLTDELARYEKPEIEKIRGLKNDEGRYELYIKPVGKPEFTVKAQYADVTAFYKSFENPNKREGEEQRKAIGQKYYEIVKIQPEHLTNLLKPNTDGINTDRLGSVNVSKDPETNKPIFSVKIDGKKYEKTVSNEIWQRFWTTSDPAAYKRAYAAVLFANELGRKESQDESIDREAPNIEEKKPVPVEIQDDAIDGQDNTTEPDIEQDDKKEIRRGGRGR